MKVKNLYERLREYGSDESEAAILTAETMGFSGPKLEKLEMLVNSSEKLAKDNDVKSFIKDLKIKESVILVVDILEALRLIHDEPKKYAGVCDGSKYKKIYDLLAKTVPDSKFKTKHINPLKPAADWLETIAGYTSEVTLKAFDIVSSILTGAVRLFSSWIGDNS